MNKGKLLIKLLCTIKIELCEIDASPHMRWKRQYEFEYHIHCLTALELI